jgi:exodeoxyribonuclease VIII
MTSTANKIVLEPGIYPGMAMEDYFRVDAVSSHTLQWMDVTPKHFKAALDGKLEREDTEAFSFGRAFHCRLLEPEEFASRYAIRVPCQTKLKSGKRKDEECGNASTVRLMDDTWACGQHDDGSGERVENSITNAELDRIECCVDAVRQTKAVKVLRQKGQCEVVIVSEYKGVKIKCRYDKLILKPDIIVDVKKIAAAAGPGRAISEERFANSIEGYGYDVQMGLYTLIAREQLKINPAFWWLVVEDDFPNCVGVFRPCKLTIKAATNHAIGLLERVAGCLESDKWPGLSDEVVEISAPRNFLRKYGQL